MHPKDLKRGFTLIELLVVITIIAILSAIGLVAYGTFLKNARNAKRLSDVKFIQSALEQYHADQKYYPYQITFGGSLTFGTKTYLTNTPMDPQRSTEYLYTASGTNCISSTPQNCTSYCIFVKIEDNPPSSDAGCSPSGDYNFGVTRP